MPDFPPTMPDIPDTMPSRFGKASGTRALRIEFNGILQLANRTAQGRATMLIPQMQSHSICD